MIVYLAEGIISELAYRTSILKLLLKNDIYRKESPVTQACAAKTHFFFEVSSRAIVFYSPASVPLLRKQLNLK